MNLKHQYQAEQSVNEIDKDASILRISLEGTNPKINDFLEKFNQLYLQSGLMKKIKSLPILFSL